MGSQDLSDSDREAILQIFAASSEDGLADMEQALLVLDGNPSDEVALQEVFRACHTFKGDALTLGLDVLASIAHALEDILDRLRAGRARMNPERISLFLTALDALRTLSADAQQQVASDPQAYAPLLDHLRASLAESEATGGDAPTPETATKGEGSAAVVNDQRRTFRVRVETVDRLLDLTGELAIARSRINQILSDSDSRVPAELEEAHDILDQLSGQLEQEVMKIRMVPVEALFKQQLRTLRDSGLALGKRVQMRVDGAKTELDTAVIEHLRDPLGHMIRNAVAHGIEPPDEREALGKDPCGTVVLRARHEGGIVVVEVEDDGAGLDLAGIRQQAVARGLAARPDELSDAEAAALVFEPGFTTVADTTMSAGRGVGMDVVRRNIEAIHGSVNIHTRAGRGTVTTARLPLTLAIIQGFGVGVGDEVYTIPLNAVSECVDFPERERYRTASAGVISLRGASLPFVRLGAVLGTSAGGSEREKIVVIRHGADQAGLCVDELYGESQAVIKPLDRSCGTLPGIAGSTILGNGDVALVLDVPALLRLINSGGAERGSVRVDGGGLGSVAWDGHGARARQ